MITGIVLASFTGVATGTQFVHGQRQCLVSLNAQGTERHRTCHEMLDDALYRLHLVDRRRLGSFFESEEIANEYRRLLLVD